MLHATLFNETKILKCISRKENGKVLIEFHWLRAGPKDSFCQHGEEHSGSINKEFLSAVTKTDQEESVRRVYS
jgi:hypothetical protein